MFRDTNGRTPLDMAIAMECPDMAEVILDGAVRDQDWRVLLDVNDAGVTPLEEAQEQALQWRSRELGASDAPAL